MYNLEIYVYIYNNYRDPLYKRLLLEMGDAYGNVGKNGSFRKSVDLILNMLCWYTCNSVTYIHTIKAIGKCVVEGTLLVKFLLYSGALKNGNFDQVGLA